MQKWLSGGGVAPPQKKGQKGGHAKHFSKTLKWHDVYS